MKKIFLLVILIPAILFSSCSLDENPKQITAEELVKDPKGAEQLVTGIYNTLWSSYMMVKTYYEWIDFDHDHIAGPDWALSGAGMGNVTTHWGYNGDSDLFNIFYRIIARCNYTLDIFEGNADLSNKALAQLYGEVFFMRAWSYFHLVRMYGPVPLRIEVVAENDCPRSSVPVIYGQIESDLRNAIAHMQYYGSADIAGWGHADKTAAELLLAKVYCNMASGKLAGQGVNMFVNICNQSGVGVNTPDPIAASTLQWTQFTTQKVMGSRMDDGYSAFDADDLYDKAITLCDQVIARRGQSFDLKANWADIWGGDNYRNNEFVWGVASTEILGYMEEGGPYYYTPKSWGGGTVLSLSDGLWKMYNWDNNSNDNDHRAVYGVFHYTKDGTFDPNEQWFRFPAGDMRYNTAPDGLKPAHSDEYVKDALRGETTGNNRNAAWSAKWYWGDITNPEVVYEEQHRGNGRFPQDIILMRYAEVYLLRAEARNELNRAGALEDLNVIRDRARAKPRTATDQVLLRSYIFEERGLEFAMEFNRKFDLHRWGMYLNVMNATHTNLGPANYLRTMVREERSLLFPVPTSETGQNKLFGDNNPGW